MLKPGGELRFYEHVVPVRPRRARFFRWLDDSGIWPKFGARLPPGARHARRDRRAGFRSRRIRRFKFNGLPHILGVARASRLTATPSTNQIRRPSG